MYNIYIFRKIIGIILMILALPVGLYMWLKWGWYDGFVMAFNSVMNEPKSASDFAWGVIKVIAGTTIGILSGYFMFIIGGILTIKK